MAHAQELASADQLPEATQRMWTSALQVRTPHSLMVYQYSIPCLCLTRLLLMAFAPAAARS